MIQNICEALGKSGCYFLSILHLAEKITGGDIDPINAYVECIAAGFMDAECYITYPGRILERYTGTMYEVSKASADAKPLPGEFEILRFERKEPGTTLAHFVVGDGAGRVEWDPYQNSKTVREGSLVSKRIFGKV